MIRQFWSALILSLAAMGFFALPAQAEDELVFKLLFQDGKITPIRIEVPAKQRFKIELQNDGETPAEFESGDLKKEKVLAPHSSSFLVFKGLETGQYPFYDDFHPDAPHGLIMVK
jgi:hypothetical protein